MLLPILLILVGFILIVAEVYLIPGFNVVGILGLLLILFAIGFIFTSHGLVGGTISLFSSVAAGSGMFYYLWNSGAWNRFILSTSLREDAELVAREHDHRARYLGKAGLAVTPLRPTGVVEIDGERIEVVTEGNFIASGSRVRVVAMDRRRYFVRLTDNVALPAPE